MRIFMKSEFLVLDPIFANNSWVSIKNACQNNLIPSTWQVGDTKELLGKDGNTYHIRLSDKQSGRYTYSSDSTKTTNAVFEFVELPDIQTQWNTSDTNVGGLADSQLRKNLNGLTEVESGKNYLTDIIPDNLRPLLEEINIVTSTGGSSFTGTSTSANKLFVPTYINVITTTEPQYVAEGTLWDYYSTHTSDADRRKALVTSSTSYQIYLTATPLANSSGHINIVNSTGAMSFQYANVAYYAAPHWAW